MFTNSLVSGNNLEDITMHTVFINFGPKGGGGVGGVHTHPACVPGT